MRPLFSITASLILLAPLAACTSSEDTALLHREITDVQRSVDRLQTEVIDQSDLHTDPDPRLTRRRKALYLLNFTFGIVENFTTDHFFSAEHFTEFYCRT